METIAPMQTVQSMQSNNVLQVRTAPNNNALIRSTLSPRRTTESTSTLKGSPFIEANTVAVTLDDLRSDFIPVFAKDNESTISHPEFIEAVHEAIYQIFPRESLSNVEYRVSHKICGRIPSAVSKPADMLEDWEKTQYFERMAFSIEIPSIHDTINGNELVLSIVGVRAYNHTNLYGRKGIETFKLAIGFNNLVCTNLCISTKYGLSSEIQVFNLNELKLKSLELFQNYKAKEHLENMKLLPQKSLTESQFATFLGRTRLYQYLPKKQKKDLPELLFGDSHLNMVAKDYYNDKRFSNCEEGYLNLWNLYNLFTNANRSSSYIDTFIDRGNNAADFIDGISLALDGDNDYQWFIQ
ncbi:MAG: DUF3871 family protein [Acidimicrobiia bacterium]